MSRAVIKHLPFPFLGIPGHELPCKASSVCQLFPNTGSGDLTHGTAPLEGSWQDAARCPAALSAGRVTLPLCSLSCPAAWCKPAEVPGQVSSWPVLRKELNRGGEPSHQLCALGARCEPGTWPLVTPKLAAVLASPQSRHSSSQGALPIPPH